MANIVNSLFGVDLDTLQRQQDNVGMLSNADISGLGDPRAMRAALAGNHQPASTLGQ